MITKTIRQTMLAASIAVLSASFAGTASAGPAEDAIADAKAAEKQAASVGGEWRDTGKMIKKAEKLLSEGKTQEALDLARAAEAQGMLGYMQATAQSNMDDLHI